MKQIRASQLADLITGAQQSSRRRLNLNLHETLLDPIQRLAIAMEPDTLILPHRHTHTWELLIPLRGRFVVLCFDDSGMVSDRVELGSDTAILEMPAGQWHAVLSLDEGGVIFEVKHGPYIPTSNDDFAHWGSECATASAAELLDWYGRAKPGDAYLKRGAEARRVV